MHIVGQGFMRVDTAAAVGAGKIAFLPQAFAPDRTATTTLGGDSCKVLRGVKRSFIAQSGGTRLRSRHRSRSDGAWPAQVLPAQGDDARGRFPPARLHCP